MFVSPSQNIPGMETIPKQQPSVELNKWSAFRSPEPKKRRRRIDANKVMLVKLPRSIDCIIPYVTPCII